MPTLPDDIQLAVGTGSFWPVATVESIRLLQQIALRDVELGLQPGEFYLTFDRQLGMPSRSDLGEMIASGALRVCSVHAPRMHTEHGYSLKNRGEYLAHTLETCRSFGAGIVVVHPFHLFGTHEQALGYLGGAISVWQALLPSTATLLELARQAGVVIALENVKIWADDEGDFFNAPGNVRRFLEEVAHPNLRFTLDVIHAQLSGCLDAFLDVLGDAIVNLHLADLVPPAQRVPPGDGILCWEELVPRFRCLPNLQQATVELAGAGPEEVARAVDFLRACWGSPLP